MRCATLIVLTLALGAGSLRPAPLRGEGAIVVENGERGLWDGEPRKTFHLLENLVLGSEEGDDAFGQISGVVVDSRGRWAILDRGYVVVRLYDPESLEIASFGGKGEGPGEFNLPTALGIDAADRFYVASQNGRVAIFSPEGELVEEFRHRFPGGGLAWSVKVGAGGTYLAWLDPAGHKVVHRYDEGHAYLSSFSDSYAVVKPMDRMDEAAFCGGAIDLGVDGTVYFTQSTPYEIRTFTPGGRPRMTIHRENDFMQTPRVERNGDRVTYHAYAASVSVLALPDGRIMNVVMVPPEQDGAGAHTIVDLFGADGRLLKSRRLEGRISLRFLDRSHRLYAIEERDYPVVVRYELKLP